MKQRGWLVNKAETLLLAACGSFWLHSCIHDEPCEYGPPPSSSGDGLSSSEELSSSAGASSSSVEVSSSQLSSSSSMTIEPQPLYGVVYSSTDEVSSSSSANLEMSSFQEIICYYGVISLPESTELPESSNDSTP